MAVVIRLSRHGTHKRPFYRIVAADKQFSRDGRYLEIVGTFDPKGKEGAVQLQQERIDYWLGQGAKASDTVRRLMKQVKTAAAAS